MITAFTAQKFDYKCQHFFLVSGRCVLCIFRPAAQRLRDRTAESPHTRSRASGTSSAKFPQLPMDCSFQFVTQDASAFSLYNANKLPTAKHANKTLAMRSHKKMVSKQVSLGWFLGLFNTLIKVFVVSFIRKQNIPIIFLVSQNRV